MRHGVPAVRVRAPAGSRPIGVYLEELFPHPAILSLGKPVLRRRAQEQPLLRPSADSVWASVETDRRIRIGGTKWRAIMASKSLPKAVAGEATVDELAGPGTHGPDDNLRLNHTSDRMSCLS